MPKVHFLNEAKTIDAPSGKTVLELAQAADVSVFKGFWKSYHCSGKGRCLGSGCKVWITELENGAASPMTSWKEKWRWHLKGNQRLACQVTITGDCEIRTQPGALEFEQDMTWEPDARRYAWHDRLVVEKKKKKAKPKPAPKPAPKPEEAPAAAANTPAPVADRPVADTEDVVETPTADIEGTQDAVEDTDDAVATPTEAAAEPPAAAPVPAPAGKRRRAVPSDTDSGWE